MFPRFCITLQLLKLKEWVIKHNHLLPGDDCSIFNHDLPSYIKDNFESEKVTEINWENIQGGVIGNGCGQLSPYAHGDSLYFNGCQIRQAITKPLDLTRAR